MLATAKSMASSPNQLTEDSSLLVLSVSSSQNALDSSLVLLATPSNTHLLGQVKRSDEKHIEAGNGGDPLNVLNARSRLDLHSDGDALLCTLGIVGSGVDSGEGMGRKHGPVAPGAEGRILAVADDLGGVLLYGIISGQCYSCLQIYSILRAPRCGTWVS